MNQQWWAIDKDQFKSPHRAAFGDTKVLNLNWSSQMTISMDSMNKILRYWWKALFVW